MSNVTQTKKKAMFNTKDMTAGSGKIRPVLDPGNHVVKINEITYDQTPYDKEAYNIVLHVESEPVGEGFEGFLTDASDETSPRYEGQVGRIRMSPWPFKDATLPSGREISRDTEVLKAMINLAEVLNFREELDMIEADTIEDFMASCNKLFTSSNGSTEFFNVCIASREWENKDGYINNDLYLPRMNKNGVPYEALNKENSRLLQFNREEHVKPVVKKNDDNVNSFEPTNGTGSDFEL
tara:strand:+ start:473 stop:1186 length:714 start_codon:yes stop_codon:yes gene_type:complete